MFFVCAFSFRAYAQSISTVAGNGSLGYCCDGSPATAASFYYAYGVAKDNRGNLYVSDWSSHRVRKVNPYGVVTTLAGTGVAGYSGDGGPATSGRIGWPYGLATDAAGNVYITDWYYYCVRKVDTNGIITTLAGNGTGGFSGDGGPATAAQIGNSWGIATDAAGNVYFSDYSNWRIRKVNTAGIITTVAGNGTGGYSGDGGPAVAAQLSMCYGIASDPAGNLFLTQWGTGKVRKVSTSGIITTFAGNGTLGLAGDGGPALAAQINNAYCVAADPYGNLFIADFGNNRIRRVDAAGNINTIGGTGAHGFSGDGGPATAATFHTTFTLATDASSNVYISDYYNARVRMILGNNKPPKFTGGHSLYRTVCANTTFDSLNSILAVIDSDSWQLATWSLAVAPLHGTASIAYSKPTTGGIIVPHLLSYTPAYGYSGSDTLKVRVSDGYASDTTTVYITINPEPVITGATLLSVGSYSALSVTPGGGIWSSSTTSVATVGTSGVVTALSPGSTVVTYTLPTGCFKSVTVSVFAFAGQMITTIAGNGFGGHSGDGGAATAASINNAYGVTLDGAGNIYIADNLNNRIRKVTTSGVITTVAGTGTSGYAGDNGPATAADLFQPMDVAFDGAGNMYIADMFNSCIRKINTAGVITTVAGIGGFGYAGDGAAATAATLYAPTGVVADAVGNLYIADNLNNCIRKVNTVGVITTIAGNGIPGYSGDGGAATAAKLNAPTRIAIDGVGNLFVSDMGNHRIRRISTAGIITTYCGTGTAGYGGDGGAATAALISDPYGLAIDPIGNIFFGDVTNNRVRRINTLGTISTIAGNGTAGFSGDQCMATASSFDGVSGIAIDGGGGVYIADANNHRTRKITFNHAPYFTGGHVQLFSVCQNAIDSINALLAAGDTDRAQGQTWSIVSAPLHGTAVVSFTATITTGVVTPTGLTYAPSTGYTGPDTFRVRITDCTGGSDTTIICVTVNPPPSAIVGASTVCAGLTTPYSYSMGTGLWTSSNPAVATIGSVSAIVTGVSAGVATITFSPGASCSVTKTVTVNPSPAPITGASSLCVGVPTTFTDATPGGIWTSSNPSAAIAGSSSGIITGMSVGIASISYTQGGCPAILPVTVNPVPATITGVFNVCEGSTTLLVGMGGGAWSSSNPAVASVPAFTGLVSGISVGSATITYTLGSGCYTTSPVMVSALPAAIGGPVSVCTGETITLTNPTPGGYWTATGITASATVDSFTGVVTGVLPGIATIFYTLPATGCGVSTSITVLPPPGAISGPSGVCMGSTATLAGPGPGHWVSSNPAVATIHSTDGIVSSVSTGITTISYLAGGCVTTRIVTVHPNPLPVTVLPNVCAGSTITATGVGGGTWSIGTPAIATVGSTTGVITGVAAGTALITYTLPTGCVTNATVSVRPTPAAISGPAAACVSGVYSYTNSMSGGTWSSSNTSVATIGSSTGYLSGVAVGTTTLTYMLSTGCMATKLISVNPAPAPITGSSGVCVGSTTSFSDATPGGTWSSGMVSIATVSTGGVVIGVSPGVATISYTAGGCAATKSVTAHPTPAAISGPGAVCVGSMITETNSVGGGTWSTTGTEITLGSVSGVVTGLSAGFVNITYAIGATSTLPGCIATRTLTVTPASPITGPSGMCGGTTITLYAAGSGSWSSSNGSIASVGSASGIVTGIANGTATISFHLTGGCTTTKTVTVNTTPTAITGLLSACPGSTTTLGNGAGGGAWTSTNTSVATIGSLSGIVTGVAVGTTTISYSLGSGCTVSAVLTVHPLPLATTGPTRVCTGATILLSNPSPGGAWSSLTPTIASVGSGTGIVGGVIGGIAAIKYTLPTGCAVTAAVTVDPSPASITGTGYVCAGFTTALGSTTTGGTWSSGSSSIATIGSGSGMVSGITPGVAVISYILPTGCYAVRTITVNSAPLPITGGSMTCLGSSIPLSDATPGGVWTSSNPSVATIGGTGILTGVALGTTNISYSAGGCPAIITVTISTLPGAITGPGVVCVAANVTLANPTPGGYWTSGSTGIVTAGSATGVVTGVSSGSAMISYSLGPGCTVSRLMSVNPLPSGILGVSSICLGATTVLTDPMPGGVWSSSNPSIATIGSTGLATGISGGIAVISYSSVVTGCAATHNLTVVTVPLTTGLANMCAWGDTIMISNPATTGSYSSTLVTVTNLGGGIGRVISHAPGTATITYTLPSGCSGASTITINPLPVAISGTTDLCLGTVTTLSDLAPGGTWSSSTPAVATIGSSSGFVSTISAGTTGITYTLPTGCKIDTVISVRIFPVAGVITGPGSLCAGQSITLADTASGGVWSSSATTIATVGSGTGLVNGVAAGVDTIRYAVTNVCGTATAIKSLTVNALPDAGTITGPDTVCVGTLITLSNMAAGGVWSSTSSAVSVSATGVVTGLVVGTDTVIYTVNDGTCSAAVEKYITVMPIGACITLTTPPDPVGEKGMTVWPNPNNGTFSILVAAAKDEPVSVVISDVTGKKMYEGVIRTNQISEAVIIAPPGMYLLSAVTGSSVYNTKVNVQAH